MQQQSVLPSSGHPPMTSERKVTLLSRYLFLHGRDVCLSVEETIILLANSGNVIIICEP